jgi:hypothetical protein
VRERKVPINLLGDTISYFEQGLRREENEENDKTLFLQLTKFELVLIQYALFWISRMYGTHAVIVLIDKLHDVIVAQEFCDCERCEAAREEREESET